QLLDAVLSTITQHVELAELDRVGRTRLRAGGFLTDLEAVVAERALEHATIFGPFVEDTVRTGGHAVAAAVADIGLDDDRPELGAEDRTGGADVPAGSGRAGL